MRIQPSQARPVESLEPISSQNAVIYLGLSGGSVELPLGRYTAKSLSPLLAAHKDMVPEIIQQVHPRYRHLVFNLVGDANLVSEFNVTPGSNGRALILNEDGETIDHLALCFRSISKELGRFLSSEGLDLNRATQTNPSLASDIIALRAVLETDPLSLRFADPEFLADKSFALEMVKRHANCLPLVSPELKDDAEVVKAALESDVRCQQVLVFASDRLKNDCEIVKIAVKYSPDALRIASRQMKQNRDVVLEAVSHDGNALCHADVALKDDEEIVWGAVANQPYSFVFASERLREKYRVPLPSHWFRG